jgi:hypothetical protein
MVGEAPHGLILFSLRFFGLLTPFQISADSIADRSVAITAEVFPP